MDQIRQPKPTPQRVPPTPLLRTPTQQGATNGKPDDQTQKALEALRLLRQTATSQKPAPVVAPSRPLLPGLGPPPAPFTDYSRVPPPQQQAFNLTPSTQKFLRGLARPEQRASPPVGGESRASTADGPKTPDEDDYKSLLDIVNKVTHKKSQYSELNQVDSRVMSCWQWLKNMKMSTTKPKWKSFRDAVLDDELFLFYLVQLGMDCSEESKKKAFVCTVPTRIKLSHANLLDDEVKIAKVDEFLSDEIEFVNK